MSCNLHGDGDPKYSGLPTGTVTFQARGDNFGNRNAERRQRQLFHVFAGSGVGHHYGRPGGGGFLSSSGSVTQKVNKPTTMTMVSSGLNPSKYGQAVTFFRRRMERW